MDDSECEETNLALSATRRMWHLNQILKHFWKRWRLEYLVGLREQHSRIQARDFNKTIALGDIALVYDPGLPRTLWNIGKVEELLRDQMIKSEVHPCVYSQVQRQC